MSILPETSADVPTTAYEVRQQGLSSIIKIIDSIKKPIKHEQRWSLTKGATNQFPAEHHEPILAAITTCYIRNRAEPIGDRQAQAEIDAAYHSQGDHDIKRFLRIATELGAEVTPEDKAAIEATIGGKVLPTSFKKLTPEEKVAKQLDESLDNAEKGSQFMSWNDHDALFPKKRRDVLRSMQSCAGDPLQNEYLIRQKITSLEGDAFVYGDDVIVPMSTAWFPNEITGYQIISNTKKRFLRGQPTIGQAAYIGEVIDAEVVLVCEGWATGQALYKATGLPVAAALSLSNILAVAAGLLNLEANTLVRSVLICADTGHDAKMQEVVDGLRAYGFSAKWCKPNSDKDNYDFLDQYNDKGSESVSKVITDTLKSWTDPNTPEIKNNFIKSLPDLMNNSKPAKALIKGVIYEKSLSSLTGATMAGKSFVAVRIAFCVATGLAFHGRKSRQANVLYIAGEGNHGLIARFKALLITSGLDEMPANLFVTAGPIDLLNPDEVSIITAFIEEHEIELVIIDTFARCFAADENSAKDVGAAIQNITKYIIGGGSATLMVHHTGHGDQSRARGSSSFRAALDTEIGVEKIEGGLKLKCWKAKDFEPWPEENFKFNVVDTGLLDEDNEPVTSLILEQCNAPASKPAELTSEQIKVVASLKRLIQPFNFELAFLDAKQSLTSSNKRQSLKRLIEKLAKSQEIIETDGLFRFV